MLKALALTLAVCFSVGFAQIKVQVDIGKGGGGSAIAGYVFGEENSSNAEELAEAVVNNLVATSKYTQPKRGAREFFRACDKEQARNRGKMLEDRNFCKIGGDFGVQYVVLIDIEKQGRGISVWARILDLNNCAVVGNAEYTGLIRNNQEISKAASALSSELVHRRMNKRSIGGSAVSAPPPPPPPPPKRGDEIAGYVYGIEEAKLGEDLADAIVSGLASHRKYSPAKRGAREFYRQADREQKKKHGRMLEDRDFCKIGSDYGVEYLCIIDIEKAGRGNSVWARILDLETCKIIATAESKALIRNDAEVNTVANEIVSELVNRRIGTRSIGR
jgi:hypothetical protein